MSGWVKSEEKICEKPVTIDITASLLDANCGENRQKQGKYFDKRTFIVSSVVIGIGESKNISCL